MKFSIRKFLLINLLLALTITTSLTAIGNYYLDQKDIQDHLDTLMQIAALSYQALLGDDLPSRSLSHIQEKLDKIPLPVELSAENSLNTHKPLHAHLGKFNFQVWTPQGKLILYSPNASKISLFTNQSGFSDKIIEQQKWRIFTTCNSKTNICIILGERYETRSELGRRLAVNDLYIMLLTFPLSGLLIWIIVGRGLDSLHRVAQEVANRAPNYLEPVDLQGVPEEIMPVIDELNQLFKRLKEGFEREKRFAADAAHELRTPLAALKAQAQVAINMENVAEKNQALEKLLTSVNRSTHIVQQLLTMSKLVPESSNIHQMERVSLGKITRDVLAMLAPSAVDRQIELEFEQNGDPFILGNATAIGILIRNLVDNALRYSHEHDEVAVRVYQQEHEVILDVRDHGPGIPPELHSRVFERFFRVLGNKSPGSGLGLAIVQQICLLHHGRVELTTPEEGVGLIVSVYFPILI